MPIKLDIFNFETLFGSRQKQYDLYILWNNLKW